jgi:hypothetical protein
VGLDNVSRINPGGRFNLPAAVKGAWEADNVFTIHWNEIANINHWQIRMTFENDGVTVQMQEATWHAPAVINGSLKQ